MNKFFQLIAMALLISSTHLYAHHPAEGIVDEEVYDMIDSMVADTPHADITFDMMEDVMETTITSRTIVSLDRMLEDDLLSYVNMLDGDVSVSMDFNPDSSVTMTITQTP